MKNTSMLFVLIIVSCTRVCAQKTLLPAADNDKIYTSPTQVMPQYKGGMERLYSRLEHNIRYLFLDRMKDIEGKIWVSLIIERDGSVTGVKMLRGLTVEEDAEVIRVIKNLSRWKPGFQDGKPVRVQFTIPIDFKLLKS